MQLAKPPEVTLPPIRFSDWQFYLSTYQQVVSFDDINFYNIHTGQRLYDNAIKTLYVGYVTHHMLKSASKLFVKITTPKEA